MLLEEASNQTNPATSEVTAVLQSSLLVLALAFHASAILLLLVQTRRDCNGTSASASRNLMRSDNEKIFFVAGALLVWLSVYLLQDDSSHRTYFLIQVYMLSTGSVTGIVVLSCGCLSLVLKPSLLQRLRGLCTLCRYDDVASLERQHLPSGQSSSG